MADCRAEVDRLRDLLADCCEVVPTAFARTGDLYAVYKSWCARGKEMPMSQTAFGGRTHHPAVP